MRQNVFAAEPRLGSLERSPRCPTWIWEDGGMAKEVWKRLGGKEWKGPKGRKEGMEFRGKVWVIGFRGIDTPVHWHWHTQQNFSMK